MFCKYCGKELRDGSNFCSKCGKQLAGASVEKVLENQKIEIVENNQQNKETQIITDNSTDTVKNQNNFRRSCKKQQNSICVDCFAYC